MTTNNNKPTVKDKAIINHENKIRKKIIKKTIDRINTNQLVVTIFLIGILLIVSTYAWLSQSLNVKVKFFDLSVSTDKGLFISLDGIDFSDSVEISLSSVITDLKATYPNHTNQWATAGLWPVSSNGIKNADRDKFDTYLGEMSKRLRSRNYKRYLNTKLISEAESTPFNSYIAFDIFLKNVSGSPKSDNLYLARETAIVFEDDVEEDVRVSMANLMNSMRVGFVRIGSVSSKSDINTIQNMKCNNSCEMVIYEPNSTFHSADSVEKLEEHGITLIDGIYSPTYAVIGEGTILEHVNGQEGSGIPLDTEHFALQKTITNFDNPIFKIPNGITKLRAYVWIEGQDMDSLETYSKGAGIGIYIDLEKDLAGYE